MQSTGLSHSRAFGNADEYSDYTNPMGSGPFMCYNLPHHFQLGWAKPPVLSAGALPLNSIVTRTITAPTRTGNTAGLMVNVKSWDNGLDNVFLNFLVAEGGNSKLGASFSTKTAVYRWGGTNFFQWTIIPSHVTSLANGNVADLPVRGTAACTYVTKCVRQQNTHATHLHHLQDLQLAVRQDSNTGTTASVQVCRYSSAASQCNWNGAPSPPATLPSPALRQPSPPVTLPSPAVTLPSPAVTLPSPALRQPSPPVALPPPPPTTPGTVTVSVVLYEWDRFSGASVTWEANWTAGSRQCWGLQNLRGSVRTLRTTQTW